MLKVIEENLEPSEQAIYKSASEAWKRGRSNHSIVPSELIIILNTIATLRAANRQLVELTKDLVELTKDQG